MPINHEKRTKYLLTILTGTLVQQFQAKAQETLDFKVKRVFIFGHPSTIRKWWMDVGANKFRSLYFCFEYDKRK